MAETINNIFTGTVTPRDITKYTLGRGVTDFSALQQYNNYETGYSFLICLGIPKFLQILATNNTEYANLINYYRHIIEYDFKGLDGLDDMSADTSEINNGISQVPVITKVNWAANQQISMRYTERQGSIFAKVHELYLRGIKDPRTQTKTYNGVLDAGLLSQAGYEYETFQFLYMNTDNTYKNIEKAYLLVSAQPTNVELSMYNSEKGDIGFKEVNVQYNCYPITGPAVTNKAVDFLKWINQSTVFMEPKFGYEALTNMPTPGNTGGIDATSATVSF